RPSSTWTIAWRILRPGGREAGRPFITRRRKLPSRASRRCTCSSPFDQVVEGKLRLAQADEPIAKIIQGQPRLLKALSQEIEDSVQVVLPGEAMVAGHLEVRTPQPLVITQT